MPLLWAIVGSVMAGCAGGEKDAKGPTLLRGRPFEPDVPVPAGFVLVEEASEDRSTGTRRLYLRHEYEGSADKYRVRDFYREQMPLARWTKVSGDNVKGHLTMRYMKGDESCTLTITSERGVFGSTTTVRVVVAREERGETPPTPGTGT